MKQAVLLGGPRDLTKIMINEKARDIRVALFVEPRFLRESIGETTFSDNYVYEEAVYRCVTEVSPKHSPDILVYVYEGVYGK